VGDDERKLLELCARARRVQNSDELVVTKAKKMGRELFAELPPDARKKILDSIVIITTGFVLLTYFWLHFMSVICILLLFCFVQHFLLPHEMNSLI